MSVTLVQQFCPRFVSVHTTNGESGEIVMKRLAAEIERSDPFGWYGDQSIKVIKRIPRMVPDVQLTNNTVTLRGGLYALTGNDKGFAILESALSFSGSYDAERNQIVLSWLNPSNQYDNIEVSGKALPPGATNCVFDWKQRETGGLFPYWIGVVMRRGQMISPPVSINLSTNSQQELDAFPFYMGVAPNWSAWSDSDDPNAVKFEQGTKPEVTPKGYIEFPDDKPFYQIIKTTPKGVQGGIWRRFLGLKPGHTFKVEVRLNTLAMDACTNDWAYSFHAAFDNSNGKSLSVAQLAGTAALPNGSKGTAAGRVALYKPSATTKGNWEKRASDYLGPGLEIKNITLPTNVTSITVWLRHSGANSTGVGMDWIRLEDVTKNP